MCAFATTQGIYSQEKLKELIEIRKMTPLHVFCALVMGSLIHRRIITQGLVNVICRDVGPRFVEVLQAMGYVKDSYPNTPDGLIEMVRDVCNVMRMTDVTEINKIDNGVEVVVTSHKCKLCIRSVDETLPRNACLFPKIFESMANHAGIRCVLKESGSEFIKKREGACKITFIIDKTENTGNESNESVET